MTRVPEPRRFVAALAPVVAIAAVAVVLLRDDTYTIQARFENAGLLVEGGEVQVAGRQVGSITDVGLSPDGVAEVEMSIEDGAVTPLRRGTRADIRAVGQAGVANRYVDLSPGPAGGPALDDGAVLGLDQTSGIVNVDALLDSFGPPERRAMQELIQNSAQIYAGSGSRYFNAMLGRLSPALAELNGFAGELARDRAALTRLVEGAGRAATAIGSRRADLTSAVKNTAQSFGAIANERRALTEILGRAPAVLEQARGTLANTDEAVTALRPALRELPPSAAPLTEFLRRTSTTLPTARPVITRLRGQLPALTQSLDGLRPLERPTVEALGSTRAAMADSQHVFRGLRIYGTDFILGVFNGIAAVTAGPYNEQGHYARLSYVQSPETALSGRGLPLLDSPQDLLPGLIGARTKELRRCPGGTAPPTPDGSSPWVPDPALCSPDQTTPAEVNEP